MPVSAQDLFNVDAIVEEARRGLPPDAGDFIFLDGLRVLAGAFENEAELSPTGRRTIHGWLVGALQVQERVRRNVAEHPEIATMSVGRPVFIIGLLRTGSTFAQNLFAEHPGLRSPSLWELMSPAGSPERAQRDALAYVEDYYLHAPQLPAIHPMDAFRPDECLRLFSNAFRSRVHWMRHYVPSYVEWLERQDLHSAYEYHKLQLRNILWRIPGEVPVMKCPFHVWSLAPLVDTYPEAHFIFLHRTPAVTIPSTCSLSAELRAARSERVNRDEIGEFWLAQVDKALDEVAHARRTVLADKPVLDVEYADLTRDTMATMARICDFIGVPLTDAAERGMRRLIDENTLKQHGEHRYSAEQFGLDSRALAERFAGDRREYAP